jgi:hypothetical protein
LAGKERGDRRRAAGAVLIWFFFFRLPDLLAGEMRDDGPNPPYLA